MTTCTKIKQQKGSHPSRGAWIEILPGELVKSVVLSRTPHGVRGLKCHHLVRQPVVPWSHPSRGAWIEIWRSIATIGNKKGRTPHGVRGLKFADTDESSNVAGRTPHGVRGLKC